MISPAMGGYDPGIIVSVPEPSSGELAMLGVGAFLAYALVRGREAKGGQCVSWLTRPTDR
jgi:hypothetical protein